MNASINLNIGFLFYYHSSFSFSESSVSILENNFWNGNCDELINAIQRAFIVNQKPGEKLIMPSDLGLGNPYDDLEDKSLLKYKYPPYADSLADFFVNEIKPMIDETFMTKNDRKYRGFGGSSMGGLFSFFIVNKYPNIFGMSLSFSPAFICHKKRYFAKYLKTITHNDVKIAFYSGGGDRLERKILKETIYWSTKLVKYGFNKDNINIVINKDLPHNEASWTKYVISALLFLLN